MKHSLFAFIPTLGNILLTISISLFLITTSACSQTTIPPKINILSIAETYDQALSIAQEWQSDAQLHSAEFDFSVDGYPDRISCSYTFLSSNSDKFLMVFMEKTESGIKPVWIVDDPWPQDRPIGTPIYVQDLNLESQQALANILVYGGNSFFARNSVNGGPLDMFWLKLERLDEYHGEGPIIWTGGFSTSLSGAQLYISIDDASIKLLRVKAYGEQEQEYWFRDITITKKMSVESSKRFFDYFDLRLNSVQYQNGKRSANLTIICPEVLGLLRGELTYEHISQNSPFNFGDYQINLLQIDPNWVEVEVMPTTRWYEPTPVGYP